MRGISSKEEDPDIGMLCVPRKLLQEAHAAPFDGKKNCWVPDEKEGFIAAEIQSAKGDDVTVRTVKRDVRRALCTALRSASAALLLHYITEDGTRESSRAVASGVHKVSAVRAGEDVQEGRRAADEPAEVRAGGGHGRDDVPVGRHRSAQHAPALHVQPDLCMPRLPFPALYWPRPTRPALT